MSSTQFCVSWDSYKSSISKGFSRLQQNSEFVDMTIAAEGHLVKVHQNVVALASPYLKAMLQSASCQHPVVFLNNISHEILGYILEYIYTGEVKMPKDELTVFLEACKALCISGVEHFILPKKPDQLMPPPERTIDPADKDVAIPVETPENNVEAHIEYMPHIESQDNNFEAHIESQDNNFETHIEYMPHIEPPDNNFEAHIERTDNTYVPHKEPLDNNLAVQIQPPHNNVTAHIKPPDNNFAACFEPADNNFAAHITINSGNYNLEVTSIKKDKSLPIISENTKIECDSQFTPAGDSESRMELNSKIPVILVDNGVTDFQLQNTSTADNKLGDQSIISTNSTDQNMQNVILNLNMKELIPTRCQKVKTILPPSIGDNDKTQLYTISNRGSLQLLLNRYMYYCHHHSCGGRKRRWRCVDYRKLGCRGVIDTDGDNIVNRSENHCHSYHDAKILKKLKSKSVFTSLSQAEEKVNCSKEKAMKVD